MMNAQLRLDLLDALKHDSEFTKESVANTSWGLIHPHFKDGLLKMEGQSWNTLKIEGQSWITLKTWVA